MYFGSVRFFRHLIIAVLVLIIVLPLFIAGIFGIKYVAASNRLDQAEYIISQYIAAGYNKKPDFAEAASEAMASRESLEKDPISDDEQILQFQQQLEAAIGSQTAELRQQIQTSVNKRSAGVQKQLNASMSEQLAVLQQLNASMGEQAAALQQQIDASMNEQKAILNELRGIPESSEQNEGIPDIDNQQSGEITDEEPVN